MVDEILSTIEISESSRVVLPLQPWLDTVNRPSPSNKPQRRHQTGIRQRLERRLLVLIQINDTTRRAEQHRHDAVAASCSSGNAGAAIYVQHIHPDSFRINLHSVLIKCCLVLSRCCGRRANCFVPGSWIADTDPVVIAFRAALTLSWWQTLLARCTHTVTTTQCCDRTAGGLRRIPRRTSSAG